MTTESVSGNIAIKFVEFSSSYSNAVNQIAECLSNDVFVERVKNKSTEKKLRIQLGFEPKTF